jgi:hypothetical protein
VVSGRIGTGIVVKRCGVRGPEALVPVALNGCIAGIDGPGSEVGERWEIDPDSDIWGARGGGAYSYGGAG